MRIALLSNVNMDPVNRLLRGSSELEIYHTQGYGNELGALINRESPLNAFQPQELFLVIDVMEVIGHELDDAAAKEKISEWFALFESSIKDDVVYYVSDAYLYGKELEVCSDKALKAKIECIWGKMLRQLMDKHTFVRCLPYHHIIEDLGERNAFSDKMWYLGKILHSADFHRQLADIIIRQVDIDTRYAKKVLILDLDNTLWRGLAGEHDHTPIVLSDDKAGLAYKNFQRVIQQMQRAGVILCVVSKNNMDDAMEIIKNHPHMVLRESDFSVLKINWENKQDNISQIAKELNLGMDSFVFIDDNPAERKLIRDTLPEVVVPDFPEHPEDLPGFMADIYHKYFEKSAVTEEDRKKTEQYRANKERSELQSKSADFNSYLEGLDMKLIRVSPIKHTERLCQLMNKTNQFNLTTRRFTSQDIINLMQEKDAEIFLYQVTDKFGDNGIVAAAIVEYGDNAVITEFTMSCRVMGRHIENAVIEDMEDAARDRGFQKLNAIYIPTQKNQPVEGLYPSVGYRTTTRREDGTTEFEIDLNERLTRDYRLARSSEED